MSKSLTKLEKDFDNVILKGVNHKLKNFSFEENSKWVGSFTFIQMADTQLGCTETFINGNDDKWDIELKYTNKCIEIINNLHPLPEFVVVCGDMINSFPGTINRKAQLSDFLKVFQKLLPKIPLICVCGNHDVGNTPTNAMIAEYRDDFGDDYFQFWVKGVKFVVINSQYFADRSCCVDEGDKHDDWINGVLTADDNQTAKHVIVFQHIPWFIDKVDEEDDYFNITIETRKKLLSRLCQAGVTAVFAGHCHKNAGGWYHSAEGRRMEMVVTSAVGYQLGPDEHGFRVVTVTKDAVSHSYKDIIVDK